MTYATRVNKISKPDGAVFMIKVRVSPDYEGGENDRTVSSNSVEGAAMQALEAAYTEQFEDAAQAGLQVPDAAETVADAPDEAEFYKEPDAAQEG